MQPTTCAEPDRAAFSAMTGRNPTHGRPFRPSAGASGSTTRSGRPRRLDQLHRPENRGATSPGDPFRGLLPHRSASDRRSARRGSSVRAPGVPRPPGHTGSSLICSQGIPARSPPPTRALVGRIAAQPHRPPGRSFGGSPLGRTPPPGTLGRGGTRRSWRPTEGGRGGANVGRRRAGGRKPRDGSERPGASFYSTWRWPPSGVRSRRNRVGGTPAKRRNSRLRWAWSEKPKR